MRRLAVAVCVLAAGCTSGAPAVVDSAATTVMQNKIKAEAIGTWSCSWSQYGTPGTTRSSRTTLDGFKQIFSITDGTFKIEPAPLSEQPEVLQKDQSSPHPTYPDLMANTSTGTWTLSGRTLVMKGTGNGIAPLEGELILSADEPVTQLADVLSFNEWGNDHPKSSKGPVGRLSATRGDDGSWVFVMVDKRGSPGLDNEVETCRRTS